MDIDERADGRIDLNSLVYPSALEIDFRNQIYDRLPCWAPRRPTSLLGSCSRFHQTRGQLQLPSVHCRREALQRCHQTYDRHPSFSRAVESVLGRASQLRKRGINYRFDERGGSLSGFFMRYVFSPAFVFINHSIKNKSSEDNLRCFYLCFVCYQSRSVREQFRSLLTR